MKDYARILTKIRESSWLITQDGLDTILGIVDRHIHTPDEELRTDQWVRTQMRSGDGGDNRHLETVNGVGVLPIHGPIFGKANMMTEFSGATSLEMFQKDFNAMMNNDQIHSVVLNIDSPGGTSDLVQEVGDAIFQGRDIKPIYAIADTSSGSAALWLMSQATASYGTPSSMIGSIGAYTVHQDRSVADAQSGQKFTYIFAGPNKTEGNPHQPLSQEGIAYRQEVINELYNDFLNVVARGRNTTTQKVESDFGGGRMLTAKKALDVGLIDAIMPYESLINQLAASAPRKVQVSMPGGKTLAGVLSGNKLLLGDISMPNLESVPEEHADPGQNTDPPLEGANTDDGADRGDRLDSPPPATQPQTNAQMRGEQLREILGIGPNDDIVAATSAVMEEVRPLREAAANSANRQSFAEQFPDQAAKLARLESKDKKDAATSFANRYANIVDADGKPTKKGFASVVTSKLEALHLNSSNGTVNLADVADVLDLIGQTGTVSYEEVGSSRHIDLNDVDVAKAFAEKVVEIQEADKVDYRTAVKLAAERHPDLHEGYQKSIPGRR